MNITDPTEQFKYLWYGNTPGEAWIETFNDGTIEILKASYSILISSEFLMHTELPWVKRDGNLVIVMGRTTLVCYELIEEHPEYDAWIANLIKKQGL